MKTQTGKELQRFRDYPFGLTMAGISSKAAGSLSNRKKFSSNELQNQEFSDGSGLEFYDFNARTYDQQIGRFLQVDPMTDEGGQESWTPYHYSYNNPIVYSDPDGKFAFLIPFIPYIAAGVAAAVTYVAVKHPINVAGAVTAVKEKVDEIKTSTPNAPTFDANAFIPLSAQMAKARLENDLAAKADKLSQKPRPGQDATKAGKEVTKELNKEKNGGQMACENCGTQVQPAKQSQKGVTPPNNEAHVDHIDPKSNGGSGTPNNLQVLCRGCNLSKGATPPVPVPLAPPPSKPKLDFSY